MVVMIKKFCDGDRKVFVNAVVVKIKKFCDGDRKVFVNSVDRILKVVATSRGRAGGIGLVSDRAASVSQLWGAHGDVIAGVGTLLWGARP